MAPIGSPSPNNSKEISSNSNITGSANVDLFSNDTSVENVKKRTLNDLPKEPNIAQLSGKVSLDLNEPKKSEMGTIFVKNVAGGIVRTRMPDKKSDKILSLQKEIEGICEIGEKGSTINFTTKTLSYRDENDEIKKIDLLTGLPVKGFSINDLDEGQPLNKEALEGVQRLFSEMQELMDKVSPRGGEIRGFEKGYKGSVSTGLALNRGPSSANGPMNRLQNLPANLDQFSQVYLKNLLKNKKITPESRQAILQRLAVADAFQKEFKKEFGKIYKKEKKRLEKNTIKLPKDEVTKRLQDLNSVHQEIQNLDLFATYYALSLYPTGDEITIEKGASRIEEAREDLKKTLEEESGNSKKKEPLNAYEREYVHDVGGMMVARDRELYFDYSIAHRKDMKKDSFTERFLFWNALTLANQGLVDVDSKSLLKIFPESLKNNPAFTRCAQHAIDEAVKVIEKVDVIEDIETLEENELVTQFLLNLI